jgi:hypothetical protein
LSSYGANAGLLVISCFGNDTLIFGEPQFQSTTTNSDKKHIFLLFFLSLYLLYPIQVQFSVSKKRKKKTKYHFPSQIFSSIRVSLFFPSLFLGVSYFICTSSSYFSVVICLV